MQKTGERTHMEGGRMVVEKLVFSDTGNPAKEKNSEASESLDLFMNKLTKNNETPECFLGKTGKR